MEQSKPLNEPSLEELMKLALEEPDGERISEVGEFILDHKVQPAEVSKVEGPTIYWFYLKWCKAKKKLPLSRRAFFADFKTRFNVNNGSHGAQKYYITQEPFEMSKDEWWLMRKVMRNEKEKHKRKAQKKGRKVPRA